MRVLEPHVVLRFIRSRHLSVTRPSRWGSCVGGVGVLCLGDATEACAIFSCVHMQGVCTRVGVRVGRICFRGGCECWCCVHLTLPACARDCVQVPAYVRARADWRACARACIPPPRHPSSRRKDGLPKEQ